MVNHGDGQSRRSRHSGSNDGEDFATNTTMDITPVAVRILMDEL